MSTRYVTVSVVSYPSDYDSTMSINRMLSFRPELEFSDRFLSDKTLYELLNEYIIKVELCASFDDDIRCYRIVLKDKDDYIFKIHKA